MLTSYKNLTGRYLKSNKKRTILSIIGIVLSVALISCIGLFLKGLQAVEVENIKDTYGSYDLALNNVSDRLMPEITDNPKVLKYGFYKMEPDKKMRSGLITNKVIASNKALEMLPFKLKKGKMPARQNEAAVEEWTLEYIDKDAKLGSNIKIGNDEYKLTGVLENSIQNQGENRVVVITKNNEISRYGSTLLVEIKPGTNLKNTVNQMKQAALNEKADVQINSMLLSVEGAGDENSGMNGMMVVLAVIIGIVIVATIAVIYNAFHISVVERIKQFGLLRAVGTTPKQIRKIVLIEASILAAIGIPIGLLCGMAAVFGISVVFKLIGADSSLIPKFVVDPSVMGISTAIGLFSIYISAFLPAYFAGKTSPLVAISSRNSIIKEDIKRRRTYLTQKVFGFEGAMALKNIKRNKKRYKITVFSIFISVVLFVTFKSFMDMSLTVEESPNESRNIAFTLYQSGQNDGGIDEDIINKIKAVKLVNKVYKSYDMQSFDAVIDKDNGINNVKSMGNIYEYIKMNGKDKIKLPAYVVIYDGESLKVAKKYLQAGKIDEEEMNKENGVIIINKNTIMDYSQKKKYVGPIADMKVGDEIDLKSLDNDDGTHTNDTGGQKAGKAKIMAVVSGNPFDFATESGLKIITTEEVAKKLASDAPHFTGLNITIKNVKDEDAAKQSIKSAVKSDPSLFLIDDIDQNRRTKASKLMIEILIYGFVAVVSLISCINIINTLTTNIILRKKEFAALKSIGMTQKELKKMIVLEGLFYGISGSIYGSIAGCVLSYVMYMGFGGIREFEWTIPWEAILIAVISTLVIGYLSVMAPLSRIKRENLIESIREE